LFSIEKIKIILDNNIDIAHLEGFIKCTTHTSTNTNNARLIEITKHIYSYKQHTSLLPILLSGLAIQFDRCTVILFFDMRE